MARWSDELSKKLSKEHQVRRGDKGTGKRWSKSSPKEMDGKNFASGTERGLYKSLLFMQAGGEIRDIRCQVKIHICGKLYWNIDFVVFNLKKSKDEAHEAKGMIFGRCQAQIQAWDGHVPMDLYIWEGPEDQVTITRMIKGKHGSK